MTKEEYEEYIDEIDLDEDEYEDDEIGEETVKRRKKQNRTIKIPLKQQKNFTGMITEIDF